MDGTVGHHCERGQTGSEDQKSYRANAAVWLELEHMTRGEHIREI
jgi:hypothetical protein